MTTLSQHLVSLSDSLKPTQLVEKRGNELLDRFNKTICKHSKFPIRRMMKAGSMGKKTAISVKIDYDCVFFIDNERYDKQAFLDDLDDILTIHFDVSNKQTKNADSFFYEGYYFDFLPGIFIADDAEKQISEIIEKNDDNLRVGLTEGTVIFMSEQSSMVHQLARLLKYWSMTVYVPNFYNGRSYTMELFAVLASQEMNHDSDLLRGFRLALDKIRNWRSVHAIWDRFYTPATVRRHHQDPNVRPLLLDPTDPANNLLSADRHDFFKEMSKAASTTLDRLDALQRGVPDVFVQLFATQPPVWDILPNVPEKSSWLCGAAQTGVPGVPKDAVQPGVRVQRGGYSQGEMLVIAHCMYAMMVARNNGVNFQRDGSKVATSQQQLVTSCVDTLFGNVKWSPSNKSFEEMEVVLFLPVGENQFVKLGFNLQPNKAFKPHKVPEGTRSNPYWSKSDDAYKTYPAHLAGT